jgi:hypothetical protein
MVNSVFKCFFIFLGLLGSSQLFSQESKHYMRLMGGYHVGVGETNFGEYTTTQGTQKNAISQTGGGIPVTLGTGYMFTKNLGCEVNVQYMESMKQNVLSTSTLSRNLRFQEVYLIPSIVIATQGKVGFYIKAGVVVPALTRSFDNYQGLSNGTVVAEANYNVSNRFIFGINGSVGIRIRLGKRFALVAEIEEVNIMSQFNEAVLESYTGTSSAYVPNASSFSYVDSKPLLTLASDKLAYPVSLRRAGINIGLVYHFTKVETN